MALITVTPPTPAQEAAQRIRDSVQRCYDALKRDLNRIGQMVWADGRAKPQEILDEFATDAAELFRLSDILIQTAAAATGEAIKIVPPGWSFTINPDGTVTVEKA